MTVTKIVHHAATVNMGDVTQEWADDYRMRVKVAIKERYRYSEVWVVDGDYNDVVISDEYDEDINDVHEFLCELWEKYGC